MLSVLLGIALLPVAAIGALVVLVGYSETAEAPDPFAPDGFICCGHPDTWWQVVQGTVFTAAAVALTGLTFLCACWLLIERRFAWRRLATHGAGLAALAVAVIMVAVGLDRDQAVVPPDCDEFRFDAQGYRGDLDLRGSGRVLLGLADCDVLTGRTPREVTGLLGPYDASHIGVHEPGTGFRDYGVVHVSFENGRVSKASLQLSSPSFD